MLNIASHPLPEELLEPVTLPSARGNKKRLAPLVLDFQRELEDDDIPTVLAGPGPRPNAPVVRELKESHHRLAQMVARGEDSNAQIALLSGYSETYIARLMNDEMFMSLVDQYGKITELKFRDTVAKMDDVGRDALNELQSRLAEGADQFANRELVEIVDSMINKPRAAAGNASSSSLAVSAPTINISFRTPQAQPDVIDVEILK